MFDQVAELYDRARPGYPPELYDDLVELAGLGRGARVLEIGCGTGQATIPLAERGLDIVCVELGESLAAVARRRLAAFPGVRVVTADFEDWEPETAGFDAVVAFTAFHWLDPVLRFEKAARLLGPEGASAWSAPSTSSRSAATASSSTCRPTTTRWRPIPRTGRRPRRGVTGEFGERCGGRRRYLGRRNADHRRDGHLPRDNRDARAPVRAHPPADRGAAGRPGPQELPRTPARRAAPLALPPAARVLRYRDGVDARTRGTKADVPVFRAACPA